MKLVRDKIPNIIKESNKTCEYHIASEDEYKIRLYEKMVEELEEFIENPSLEEAADIYEVLSSMCALHSIHMTHVTYATLVKRKQRGGFEGAIVLERVSES